MALLTAVPALQVSDFGLALVMDNDTSHVSGVFTGTITHMAPECLQDGRQSYAADVYAFGIVLFELLSAQGAYANKSSVWIIDAVVNKRQRPHLPADTPVDVLQLFIECIQHDPVSRPTMEEVVERLSDLLAKYSAVDSTVWTAWHLLLRPVPDDLLYSRMQTGTKAQHDMSKVDKAAISGGFETQQSLSADVLVVMCSCCRRL